MLRRKIDNMLRSTYCTILARTGNHVLTCEQLHISRKRIQTEIDSDPLFAEQVKEAQAQAVERLEGEAYRRAVIGIDEPVFYEGVRVDTVRKYSDGLLSKLLEANDPARFGAKMKLSGDASQPIRVQHDLSVLNEEQLADLEKLLTIAATSKGGKG